MVPVTTTRHSWVLHNLDDNGNGPIVVVVFGGLVSGVIGVIVGDSIEKVFR